MKKVIFIILILIAQTAMAQKNGQPVIIDKMQQAGNYNIELHTSKNNITVYLLDSTGHQLPNSGVEGMMVLWLDAKKANTFLLKPKGEKGFTVKTDYATHFISCEVIFTINKKKIKAVFKNE